MSAPPRAAEWLLLRSVRRAAVARSIIGDLWEEHATLLRSRNRVAADLWYWLQAVRISAGYRFGAVPPGGNDKGPEHSRFRWIDELLLDMRFALRGLRRDPAFATVVVATLALAIGANATMFGVIDRLLLSAPPLIIAPDQVVRLQIERESFNGARFTSPSTSYPVFRDFRDGTRSFAGLAAVSPADAILGRGEGAISVTSARVSGNYFELLGPAPALGRYFTADNDQEPAGTPVAVVGNGLWRRHFGSAPAMLGSEIFIDGSPYVLIGVAPAGFSGDDTAPVDLWIPINAAFADAGPSWREQRVTRILTVIGRVASGTSHEDAAADARNAFLAGEGWSAGEKDAPDVHLGSLIPGRGPGGTSQQGQISLWLGGVTLVVLLIAIANVTNLLLLRAQRRRHEVAVRLALGMGRGRLLRQLVTESLLLAAVGGAAALLVTTWASSALRTWLMPNMATPPTAVDNGVLLVTGGAALLAGLTAGVLPALHVSARAPGRATGSGRDDASVRRSLLRDGLLLAQTCLSVVLLVGAGLFVTSLYNVQSQNLGIQLDGVLLAEIKFQDGVSGPDQDEIYRDAIGRVRQVPGVDTAIAVQALPFGRYFTQLISFPGQEFAALFGDRQMPYFHAVEPGFFDLMGVEILAGRALNEEDNAAAPPAVVISESLARYVWPEEPAVGKCMRAGFPPGGEVSPDLFSNGAPESAPCYEIVGIAADIAERSLLPEARLTMQWYTTFEQLPLTPDVGPATEIWGMLIGASGDADATTAAVQSVMQASSDRIPYVDIRPYTDLIDPRTRSWRLGAAMFSAFGALALLIAAIGMYGVLAYAVSQRGREMGVRMALGAQPADVVTLVAAQSLRVVLVGVIVGGAISLWAARYVEALLYETSPSNPLVLAGVVALLGVVAILASALPAWRATRIDPKVALSARGG